MYCTKCGKMISDTSNFCGYCGNPVTQRKNVCPSCGSELEADMVYCSSCGTRVDAVRTRSVQRAEPAQSVRAESSREEMPILSGQSVHASERAEPVRERQTYREPAAQTYRASEPVRPAAQTSAAAPSTAKLASAQVSWYLGDVKVGVAKATGKLEVYRDRVELQKQFGSSGAAAFGLLGVAVSAAKAKADPTVSFSMTQIAAVRESKYSGAFPAMVITMKNGEKHTFAGTMNARDINNCVKIIQANIR